MLSSHAIGVEPADKIRDEVDALAFEGEPTEADEQMLANAKMAAIKALNLGIVGPANTLEVTDQFKVTLSGETVEEHAAGEFATIRIEKAAAPPPE